MAGMKKVLVTGGAGFIGTHLCRRLVADGCHVICLDNLYTGSVDNIKNLTEQPGFQFVEYDVTQPIILKSMKSITWPVRPVRCIIRLIRSEQRKPVCWVQSARWNWLKR